MVKKSQHKHQPKDLFAQTLVEYVILIGIVAIVLTAMGPLIKRTIQAFVKVAADQLAPQGDAEQDITEKSGYLINSSTQTITDRHKRVQEVQGGPFYVEYFFYDTVTGTANTAVNMGFTNRADY